MPEQNYVVLFADIAGSMQLYSRLGDEAAKSLVIDLQREQAALIESAGGVVQEFIGDEVMARFVCCEDAANVATDLHECALQFSDSKSVAVQTRIGLHYGPAIVENERMFGDTVNIAARVASIAKGGQTITTDAVVKQLSPEGRLFARHFDTTKIKGKDKPLVIHELTWQRSELTTIKTMRDESQIGYLLLKFGDAAVELDLDTDTYSIGRAVTNSLVVHGESVSRRHASIEVVRGRFVVSDNSTNGTHVYLSNGEEIYLRREKLPIWGQGVFSLGAPSDEGVNHVVAYECNSGSQLSD